MIGVHYIPETHPGDYTLKLMEKAARLQVLSPVKRVVFLNIIGVRHFYNDFISFLDRTAKPW